MLTELGLGMLIQGAACADKEISYLLWNQAVARIHINHIIHFISIRCRFLTSSITYAIVSLAILYPLNGGSC